MARDGEVGSAILYGPPRREHSDRGRLLERTVMTKQDLASGGNRNGFSQANTCPLRWVVYGLWVALATVMVAAIVRESLNHHENGSKEVFEN
jgi:hypothetical protein